MKDDLDKFKPSAHLEWLIKGVQEVAKQTTTFKWDAVFQNIPEALISHGLFSLPESDLEVIKKTPMPDEWLIQAAKLPTAGRSALQRLERDVVRDGFVSIEAADRFCAVERLRERLINEGVKTDPENGRTPGRETLSKRLLSASVEVSMEQVREDARSLLIKPETAVAGPFAFRASTVLSQSRRHSKSVLSWNGTGGRTGS